ncbi:MULTISPECIES: DUF881 domain-containing protein [unclassified Schaalia]|uniref:DUF881 domain-containing protein n=1 Tax=unclassified Schaalia TaxID=2691889 RepID=UPI001E5F95B0|nr:MULTISPECIES: DUF881 domain-containing protein [unclassified Schaalia]MCD4550029.1 DUF881 domain-containing protein [Schaalia sp. lx-260]MCD4557903.1 DUF881 domain-containing protein [Schaalia sp. lx-100]
MTHELKDDLTPSVQPPTNISDTSAQKILKRRSHVPHRKYVTLRHKITVFIVTLAAGFLFILPARLAFHNDNTTDGDLVNLVRSRQNSVNELEKEHNALADHVQSFTELAEPETTETSSQVSTKQSLSGPGVVITLTDSMNHTPHEGLTANDLVIHQQDIEDVMNALWSGGAESMTVQGIRVTSRTVIRCIGNVILVDGTSYSPPYTIAAIGNPEALTRAVYADPRVANYLQYVALYGLGWEMKVDNSLHMPRTSQDVTLSYAKVVD